MALDRQHAQQYLDNKELDFMIDDGVSEPPLIIRTTVTNIHRLRALMAEGFDGEITPCDSGLGTEFYGWTVEELVESLENSDFEDEFNRKII